MGGLPHFYDRVTTTGGCEQACLILRLMLPDEERRMTNPYMNIFEQINLQIQCDKLDQAVDFCASASQS